MLWATLLGEGPIRPAQGPRPAQDVAMGQAQQIRELEHAIGRLSLMNQALWEIIRDRLQVSEENFEALVKEIDLRDGVPDGKITQTAMQCPTCHRVSSSRHWKCLYCGQLFEKPMMG